MRWIRNFAIVLILMWVVGACLKQPEYNTTPEITFSDFYYGFTPASGTKNAVDSIVLSFNFKDGDGDIGLETADNNVPPFGANYYFYMQGGQLYYTYNPNNTDKGVQYINYHTKKTNPNLTLPDLTQPNSNTYVTLPDLVPPYDCFNWELKYKTQDKQQILTDTIYKQENPYNKNMFVDFWVKDNSGFSKFDLSAFNNYPNCSSQYLFAGRIPILSQDLGKASPLTGVIHYTILSPTGNLKTFFNGKTLKLHFYIVDRALNQSTPVDSPEFTLQSISK